MRCMNGMLPDSELLLPRNQVCFPTYAVANKILWRYQPLLIELDLTYPVITDIREMLEYDCKDSASALPEMSKSLALFEDDYVTAT